MIDFLTKWVIDLMTALGYPGLALVMFLENVFPPIPSEIVLPLAGSLTIDGPFDLVGITLVGTLGSLAGGWFFYGLGHWYDETFIRGLVRKYGKWILLKEDDLNRALDWFHRYGDWVVFFGRMVPIVRSLISIPAGMAHMNVLKFTLYTALGTAIWNLTLALAGRLLGQGWRAVSEVIERFQGFTIALIVALISAFLISRLAQFVIKQTTNR
jgi:membrane protein DedA with SNARE-associated domain